MEKPSYCPLCRLKYVGETCPHCEEREMRKLNKPKAPNKTKIKK